jgi:predicted TIM-barrel fold metal-dependent hydrolase
MLGAAAAAGAVAQPAWAANAQGVPMIDGTSHIWDPSRPISTPHAPTSKGMSAAELRARAPDGVVGAVVIESSPWFEDNLWLLDAVRDEPFVVGVVGNLRPDDRDFPAHVERYNRDPLYLGIRHGNVWPGYDLPEQIKDPQFLERMKLLAQADLVLDVANPRLNLLQSVLRINDAIPDLRIIVDHLAGYVPQPADEAGLEMVLREYAQRPNVYGKMSGLVRARPDEPASVTVAANRERLDRFYNVFGEDRVMGGSFAPANVAMYVEYMKDKPRRTAENFFWRTSARVYRWTPRAPNQPRLS